MVDASAVLDLLFRPRGSLSIELQLVSGEPLAAPDHMLVETARVVRRRQLAGTVEPGVAGEMVDEALALGIQSHPCADLIPRAWELRDQFFLDDALYVALAEGVDGTLLTSDRKLASHASRFVEVSVPA
ncbi:MAG: hypothetical protein BGO23_10345 [Solirubrobacterales bacterium 67-14]|nr:MAG: hypothetical protein BGO23_10345 [Solirubrobacterales bacterium 67-14]